MDHVDRLGIFDMTGSMDAVLRCDRCGKAGARDINNQLLCDQCAHRMARAGLMAGPPKPWTEELLTGPDGRTHHFRYRVWPALTGVVAEAEGTDLRSGEGYRWQLMGERDAEIDRLVADLKSRVRRGVSTLYLKPQPRTGGWLIADANLKGRIEYRDGGPPFEVVVDGRRLSWEEFGRTLEPFAGWDFELRFCDTERVDTSGLELNSASNVVSLRGPRAEVAARITKAHDPRPLQTNVELVTRAMDASPTIDKVLNDFLAEQKMRLSARTYRRYAHVVGLLKRCLNGYGHLSLNREEHARWEEASESENDEAFCQLFTTDKIASVLPKFFGHFMPRKVVVTEWQLRTSCVVIKTLVKWLADAGLLDGNVAAEETKRADAAGRRLPPAHRLARLLREQAEQSRLNVGPLADSERVEGCLAIEDVEPDALWFEGGIGPVRVPKEVSEVASPGYSVNIVLGRQEKLWHILEVGFVHA